MASSGRKTASGSSGRIRETDLFEPIRGYLENQGFEVNAEVVHCDVTATKGDELLVVELKTSATMQLLVQATERQKITDSVYVAIPAGVHKRKHFLGVQRVLKRLELGLIVVDLTSDPPAVKKHFDPLPHKKRKVSRKKRAVIREISRRSANYNVGGSSQSKLVTAYRENAILVAACLEETGATSPKELRKRGTGWKTQSILSDNHYGWFQRIDRGVYELTSRGRNEVREYPELYAQSRDILTERAASPSSAGPATAQPRSRAKNRPGVTPKPGPPSVAKPVAKSVAKSGPKSDPKPGPKSGPNSDRSRVRSRNGK